jgi:hypothetical protein
MNVPLGYRDFWPFTITAILALRPEPDNLHPVSWQLENKPMIGVSLIFVVMGVFGLFIAASAADSSAQFMGLGLMLFSWFFMVAYHGRRAEQQARQGDEH